MRAFRSSSCRLALLSLAAIPLLAGAQREGASIAEVTDADGDLQIQMESEWISLQLQPQLGSTIVRFVFRPTGNDILDEISPKVDLGGGLLQDNLWGQDWRYSELRAKFYDYQIIRDTPEEVAVTFETSTVGWLQANNSGMINKLWSNVRIRRTVTMRAGAPYFLVDLELASTDGTAKMPAMWIHNAAVVDPETGDQCWRPSARGGRRIGAPDRKNTLGFPGEDEYIRDFNEGWTAQMSATRKEGLVFLMDYDYLQFLYNCGTTTTEWVCDNLLLTKDHPWKSRIYILPVMGLARVDHANEHFVMEVVPTREKSRLSFTYRVTGSYEPVKRITFNTELESDHLSDVKRRKLDPVEVEGLGVAPVEGTLVIDDPPDDPLLLNIKAHVELLDGTVKTREFQVFHLGGYGQGDNVRIDLKTPVAKLQRHPQKPYVPEAPANATVNRSDWRVFAVLGNHTNRSGLREAIRSIPARLDDQQDVGFTPGFGDLTDFPYDYDRLFATRVVVWANAELDVARRVGASVLAAYLQRGGGLVLTGGDSAYRSDFADSARALDPYVPFQPKPDNLRQGILALREPVADHPIFTGIDLTRLPVAYYHHDLEVKPDIGARVLMKAGDKPFIVELTRGDQRTIAVLDVAFGDPAEHPGTTPFWAWDQWRKLMANIVRYAGHDL